MDSRRQSDSKAHRRMKPSAAGGKKQGQKVKLPPPDEDLMDKVERKPEDSGKRRTSSGRRG